jgi:hypothetical protein
VETLIIDLTSRKAATAKPMVFEFDFAGASYVSFMLYGLTGGAKETAHGYSHARCEQLRVALPTEPTTSIFSGENLRRGLQPVELCQTKNSTLWWSFLFGGPSGTRTHDTLLKRQVL